MALAVFISGRLTSPLAMLSSRLASVELGKKSEHLSYKGNDEVGDLVRQYNIMVDELEESARKLADSEREYAWREMAKQIEHEIMNPLSPMKLNIQQLYKSWTDRVPGFERNSNGLQKTRSNISTISPQLPQPSRLLRKFLQQIRSGLILGTGKEHRRAFQEQRQYIIQDFVS